MDNETEKAIREYWEKLQEYITPEFLSNIYELPVWHFEEVLGI
ncbi:hypothetical protein [Treponema primitia]